METMYRFIEAIDGENGLKLIPYRIGQCLKLFCLRFIN